MTTTHLRMALEEVTGLFALLFILQCWPSCDVYIFSFSRDADFGAPFSHYNI